MNQQLLEQALEALEFMIEQNWSPLFTAYEYNSDLAKENEARDRILAVVAALKTELAKD
jgi:hypothetical protein